MSGRGGYVGFLVKKGKSKKEQNAKEEEQLKASRSSIPFSSFMLELVRGREKEKDADPLNAWKEAREGGKMSIL